MYGVVASAFDKKAVEKIYSIRKRDLKKPLIILIDSLDRLQEFGIKAFPKEELKKIWPDKITVILPCPQKRFEYLHRGTNALAFRFPKGRFIEKFLKQNGPIVAPSANISGMPPATTIVEAKKYFGYRVDFYINGGKKHGKPSTIVKFEKGKWKLVREGAVKAGGKKLKNLLQ